MASELVHASPTLRSGSRWVDLFGIDPRTLAVARMALAAVLLYNLAARALELELMYSDSGLYPVADVRRFWGPDTWRWSLHLLGGSVRFQGVLFALAGLAGVLLLLGCWTRLATIVSWALLASLHTRAPALVTGGDALLIMMLFWGMFLPWGQRCSIDSLRRRAAPVTASVVNCASAAILLQIAFMYWFTGFSKCNYLWFEGRALESVFQNLLFTRPLGQWLLGFPWLLQVLTIGTLVLELLGPPLMFCPWRTRQVRVPIVLCFALLHVGIELTMSVVIFSYASLAALTLFIPGTFWSRAVVRRLVPWCGGPSWPDAAGQMTRARPTRWVRRRSLAANLVSVLVMVTIVIVSPLAYFGGPEVLARVPRVLRVLRDVGSLDQEWSMFSCPATHNYRYLVVASLQDGTQMDLLRDEPFRETNHPETLSLDLPSHRWVQIMVDLARNQSDVFRTSVIRYFAQRWNRQHPASERVVHVQLALLYEPPAPGAGLGGVERLVLAQYDPFADGVYRDGKREGRWTFRYPSGAREAEGSFRAGKEEGRWTLWYEDGRKQGEGQYADGRMEGRWKFWYETGDTVEAYFHHGVLVPRPLADASTRAAGPLDTDSGQ
ncbi:MAG: HTTM domain-containing protein [Pirellulaceae bacterium]|nr:HTTM domain-containing protein [Pirellulaceae bacterium]